MREDVEIFGWDNFDFKILEECRESELSERERFYFNLLKPEYNTKIEHCWTHTPSVRERMSKSHSGKAVPLER